MKQLTATIITALFCAACGTSPQNDSRALVLSDTKIIKITHGTPHPIRADNARIIGMDEMLDRVKSIEYIKLDSSEPIGVIRQNDRYKRQNLSYWTAYTAQQIFVFEQNGQPVVPHQEQRPGAERISEHQRYAGRHHPE